MKTQRSINYIVLALLSGATCLHAAEPLELTTLRAQHDKAVGQVQQEAQTKERRLNEQYAQYLDNLMQRLARAGNLDAALAVREEKNRILPLLGREQELQPSTPSAPAPTARSGGLQRLKTAVRSRTELLAEAKQKLDAEQYTMAEKIRFDNFKFDRAGGGSFCTVYFSTTASVEDVQNTGFRVRVRYLCENADKRMLVLEGFADIKPNVKKGIVQAGSGMVTRWVMQNNNNNGTPLNAHAIILFHDVPIYEGLWQTTDKFSKYSADGQTPWWDDDGLIKKPGNQ